MTWLTEDRGRISTIIKGSQRPKSMFLGQYDLFYTCEILYYAKETQEVYVTRECAPLSLRIGLRSDWKAAAMASYLTDLALHITLPSAPHGELYTLMNHSLDYLASRGATPAFIFWHELKLLDLLGLSPRLRICLDCGNALIAGAGRTRFSYARGGILCGTCAARHRESTVHLAADVWATLTGWQRSRTPQVIEHTRSTQVQLDAIEKFLGLFLSHHLEMSDRSRQIAFDVLHRKIA